MLEEQSNSRNDYVDVTPPSLPSTSTDQNLQILRDAIGQVMMIEQTEPSHIPIIVADFVGQLVVPAETVIDTLDPTLKRLGVYAYFSQDEEKRNYRLRIVRGRLDPKPRPWWPNAVLFVITLLSLFFVGASIQAGQDGRENLGDLRLWEGWPYALSLILILGSHELGHYFAARRHNVSVTLPYFIPFPLGFFGTLGAFIQLREPMKNKNVLFDVGVAGPLSGLIFAIPILLYGLATSHIEVTQAGETILREGNSILYALAKLLTFGRFLPDGNEDVLINQFAQAGWVGLFVTSLNLVPVGQLDGGHIMYTLLGKNARRLFWPAVFTLMGLSLFVTQSYILWTVLLFVFGRVYAVPLDDVTPLTIRRRMLGIFALILFVLIFVPNPIEIIE